ncbi:hypothetical protein KR093_004855 [Drosophila rubida]|uniref:PIN domain-containing protein n=1 Tax=Drosophila rubida TaxID=30044 RepID=A0AAD4KAI7_9MUSC|nr:hypothetical protein KR093_004855 [Drosophila rubida]
MSSKSELNISLKKGNHEVTVNDYADNDNTQNRLGNIRQRQSRRNRTPAQERLERLQSKLLNGRITKEKHVSKRSIRNLTNPRPTNLAERLHNVTPSTALRNFAFASQIQSAPVATPAAAASSFQSRRAIANNPFAKLSESSNSGVRSTWAKPKALIDASNRLQTNRAIISANSRLAMVQASLRQRQRVNSSEDNNNNVPNNAMTNPTNDDDEPMEIEAMDVDTEQEDIAASLEQSTTNETVADDEKTVTKSTDDVAKKASQELPERMLDHMYYVLDTNILMENLSFVDDLSRLALGDSKGSMLFIPYVVIKELDKLKDRRSEDDAKKRAAAVRAIHYLNNKFDKSLKIQGQSALEDAEHLIEVVCGDDSVVNCCVQLSSQVPKLTLLTNDANLQLKAKTSSITVASRLDLLSRYRKDFDVLQL